ncbi:MAG: RNA pseudouridine synthase, partial [Bacteroidaceae bacterium]|nr:RNA pseudouridine synthase [Bacteroidaceae bacterium]
MLHPLPPEAAGIPSPQQFTYPFCYQPHPLCQLAAKEVIAHCYKTPALYPHEGKMFGVLIVEHENQRYYLCAFSGIYNGSYHHEGFVPPIC